jgi:prephenate dehydrogenase
MGKDFLSLAGPGFRDFTRIAASDPKMWRDILLSNREELLAQSKIFPAQPAGLEADDLQRQRRRAGRLIDQASKTPRRTGAWPRNTATPK